jgi:hypothetical protein
MMKVACTSETLVNLYQSTWRYNPEDSHLATSLLEPLYVMHGYVLFHNVKWCKGFI